MGSCIKIPCETEARYNAYRDLKAQNSTPEKIARAVNVLGDSSDWLDRATADYHRQAIARAAMKAEQADVESVERARELAGVIYPDKRSRAVPFEDNDDDPPAFGFWAVLIVSVIFGGSWFGSWVQSLWIGGAP